MPRWRRVGVRPVVPDSRTTCGRLLSPQRIQRFGLGGPHPGNVCAGLRSLGEIRSGQGGFRSVDLGDRPQCRSPALAPPHGGEHFRSRTCRRDVLDTRRRFRQSRAARGECRRGGLRIPAGRTTGRTGSFEVCARYDHTRDSLTRGNTRINREEPPERRA